MKIFFFILLFPALLIPQRVEFSAVGYSVLSGVTAYNQIQDRELYKNGDPGYLNYSENWHALQTLEAISLVNVGVQIEVTNQSYFPGIVTDVFLTGAIRWIVRDGTYNLLMDNSFFYQSQNSMAQLESFGTPFIKLSFLTAILFFKYFVLPKL